MAAVRPSPRGGILNPIGLLTLLPCAHSGKEGRWGGGKMKPNISISKNRGYSNPSDHDGFAVVRVHNGHLAGLGGK